MACKRLVLCSARGGSGKSSLAVGIAKALARGGKRVCLLDLDTVSPSLDLLLGCEDRVVYTLGDLITLVTSPVGVAICPSDTEGLFFIPGAFRLNRAPTKAELERVLSSIERTLDTDFLVLDTASPACPIFAASVQLAQTALLVMCPDPLGVRSATSLLETLLGSRIPDIRLIVNLFSLDAPPDLRDIVDTTRRRLVGVVPKIQDFSIALLQEAWLCAVSNIAARLSGDNPPLLHGVLTEKERRRILRT